ncbi:hypothetical protein D3C87_1847100 [compost metagenome]
MQACETKQDGQRCGINGGQPEYRQKGIAEGKVGAGGKKYPHRVDNHHLGDDINGGMVKPCLAEG